MDSWGINGTFLAFQILNCGFFLTWPILSITALWGLRKGNLSDIARAIWALLIIAVPILGAVAFWIVNPNKDK